MRMYRGYPGAVQQRVHEDLLVALPVPCPHEREGCQEQGDAPSQGVQAAAPSEYRHARGEGLNGPFHPGKWRQAEALFCLVTQAERKLLNRVTMMVPYYIEQGELLDAAKYVVSTYNGAMDLRWNAATITE